MNPYWAEDFFSFFVTLGKRLFDVLCFQTSPLASDELQLIVLFLASITLSVLGCYVVVNRLSMLANSLSHTVLVGIVIVYLIELQWLPHLKENIADLGILPLMVAALLSATLTVLLTFILKKWARLPEDASIGLSFTTLFAIGIILVTLLTRSAHLGIEAVMGNIEALQGHDAILLGFLATLTLGFVILFFHPLLGVSFDPLFSACIGMHPAKILFVLLILCSLAIVGCFKAIGVILVLSLLTAPVLIARLFTNRIKMLLILSTSVAMLCSLIAVALTRHILSVYNQPLSTSGVLVTLLSLLYGVLLVICKRKRALRV